MILLRNTVVGVVLLLLGVSSAQATIIVDTGIGANNTGGAALSGDQSLAGQFTIESAQSIYSIEGWIGYYADGAMSATIYTEDGGGIPGTKLFTEMFTVSARSNYNGEAMWQGVFGLNRELAAGTYWLSFAVGPDTGALVPGGYMPFDVSNPLDGYAFTGDGSWYNTSQSFGIRIGATGVPEPASVVLMSLGLIGLSFARRKNAA